MNQELIQVCVKIEPKQKVGIVKIAKENKVSEATVHRWALDFFLNGKSTKCGNPVK